jgi:hypothetical protein
MPEAFFVFGGMGYAAGTTTNFGYLRDLWMFNMTTRSWRYLSGQNATNVNGERTYISLMAGG